MPVTTTSHIVLPVNYISLCVAVATTDTPAPATTTAATQLVAVRLLYRYGAGGGCGSVLPGFQHDTCTRTHTQTLTHIIYIYIHSIYKCVRRFFFSSLYAIPPVTLYIYI